jgi:acetyl-CoA carboxylase carboxyl transferase subunit beta
MVLFKFKRDKPKIKVQSTKKDGFSGWLKCTSCHELIHSNELEQNLNCCPKCDSHYRLSVEKRLESLADEGTFEKMFQHLRSADPLKFVDSEPYPDRIEKANEKSTTG